jgi:hypothetical protein
MRIGPGNGEKPAEEDFRLIRRPVPVFHFASAARYDWMSPKPPCGGRESEDQ